MPQPDFFASVQMAPPDPIFGLRQKFVDDTRTEKIDLCVGIYLDESGQCRKLPSVIAAEQLLRKRKDSGELPEIADYMPITGNAAYLNAARILLFGDSASLRDGRTISVQSVGGTGGLRYAADILALTIPTRTVYISDPSWPVHRNIFQKVGYTCHTYPYYDAGRAAVDEDRLLQAIRQAPAGSVIVLHACCHNPTGMDLSRACWTDIITTIEERGLFPLVDIAYQGFAQSLDEDAWIVREFDRRDIQFAAAQSFSKNFSLYNRRTGALHIRCRSADVASRLLSQLKSEIRVANSNPPIDGSEIVATILNDAKLRNSWELDVTHMRERMTTMRTRFVDALAQLGCGTRFEFLRQQRGMFSYSGLTREQSIALRESHALYILESGRICVAALNDSNLMSSAKRVAAVALSTR